ncbi:MAG: hypothetical protein II608_00445 [Oscillospiraceae bacterium]|nr:hypothetical protein [Oscillospiraceae bacterium]MBQ4015986.1 hypothetical protein [Oscillospiraceae bacterium]
MVKFHFFFLPFPVFFRFGIPLKHSTDFRCFPLPFPCPAIFKKILDKAPEIGYIIGALRRQQVGFPVNPAEDNNDPKRYFYHQDCFCAFLSVRQRGFLFEREFKVWR